MKRILPLLRRRPALALLVLCGLLAGPAVPARAAKEDAFSLENSTALGKAVDKKAPATAPRIDFRVEITPATARRGETVQLRIIGTPRKGFHTYPITQRADNTNQDEAQLSKIVLDDAAGLEPLYPVHETAPEKEETPGLGYLLVYDKQFIWSQDLLIPDGVASGKKLVRFHVRVQVCNDKTCLWGDHHFEVPLTVSDAAPVAASAAITARQAPTPIQVVPVPGESGGSAPPPPSTPPGSRAVSRNIPGGPSAAPGGESAAPVAAAMPDTAAEHKADLDEIQAQLQGVPPATAGSTGLLAFMLQGVFWGFISLLT
ncbi:MAG TPA: hypothetical protein VJ739_15185, partial [Gemmataceae bacterium]|nr:hypothetical protein [Gemmataceae bacterium]